MMRLLDVPNARAASTYSFSRRDRNSARITRAVVKPRGEGDHQGDEDDAVVTEVLAIEDLVGVLTEQQDAVLAEERVQDRDVVRASGEHGGDQEQRDRQGDVDEAHQHVVDHPRK